MRQGILNSLDFHERVIRRQQLGEIQAKEKTFEWIWTSRLKDWLSSSERLFWIAGKPASGKSTLMDHLSRSKRLLEILESNLNEEYVLVHHFFDYRARDMIRNNFSGFLRSLLFQLLSKLPGIVAKVQDIKQRELTESREWSVVELRSALDLVLNAASKPIFLLLDGLDEYEGNKIELANFVKNISTKRVKICIATRPDPPFPDAFRNVSGIRMDRLNFPGILAFASETLFDFWTPSEPADSKGLEDMATEVAERANGVFLWARFAVFEVIEGKTRGETHSELQARLENVPPDLEAIYSRILNKRSPSEKATVSRLLQLLCYARQTMSLPEVFSAMSFSSAESQWHSVSFDSVELVDFRKKMLASAGGIVETFELERRRDNSHRGEKFDMELVQVIHRTVQFYLDRSGWSDLQVDDQDRVAVEPDYLWLQVCAKVLQSVDLKLFLDDPESFRSNGTVLNEQHLRTPFQQIGSSARSLPIALPRRGVPMPIVGALLWYVLLHLPEHAGGFERESGRSSYKLIGGLLSEHYVRAHKLAWVDDTCNSCGSSRVGSVRLARNCPQGSLWIAIAHGLVLYIQDSLLARGSSPKPILQAFEESPPDPISRHTKLRAVRSAIGNDPELVVTTSFAINAASKQPTLAQKRILQICLATSPIIEDVAFRFALSTASLEVIQILLDNGDIPRGKIVFMSDTMYDPHDEYWDKKYVTSFPIRPLWEVGKRFESSENDTIIDLFLRRGEEINDQCGPTGTVIHSLLQSAVTPFRHGYTPSLLRILLHKGADINAQGPEGRPLEYIWKLANTSHHRKMEYVSRYRAPLHDLIDFGAINRNKDPNGEVPSVERMRSWPRTYSEYMEYKRYYHHGPLPDGWEMRVKPGGQPNYVNLNTNTTTQDHPTRP